MPEQTLTVPRPSTRAEAAQLLQRGLLLEYATLAWNVVGCGIILGSAWLALTVVAMLMLAYGKQRTGMALGNPVLVSESRVTVVDGALAGAGRSEA